MIRIELFIEVAVEMLRFYQSVDWDRDHMRTHKQYLLTACSNYTAVSALLGKVHIVIYSICAWFESVVNIVNNVSGPS